MTVSTEVDHNEYTGNGVTTSFPYTFRIFQKSDLVVQVVDLDENITVLALDTDYTVTGAGGYNGGNVILSKALANGYQISISRELKVTQETDLRNQGKFFAEVHEDAFDKLTMLIQQVRSWFSLALRKPSFVANYYDALGNYIRNLRDPSRPHDAATKSYVDGVAETNLSRTLRTPEPISTLPGVEQRKNKIVAMDDSGDPIMVLPESGSATDVMLQLAATDGFKNIGSCPDVATLRNTEPSSVNQQIIVRGYYSDTPGLGGGTFMAFASSEADDGVNIFVTAGGKRWKRTGSHIDIPVENGGMMASRTAEQNSEALERIHSCLPQTGGKLRFSDFYDIKYGAICPPRVMWEGIGRDSCGLRKTGNDIKTVPDRMWQGAPHSFSLDFIAAVDMDSSVAGDLTGNFSRSANITGMSLIGAATAKNTYGVYSAISYMVRLQDLYIEHVMSGYRTSDSWLQIFDSIIIKDVQDGISVDTGGTTFNLNNVYVRNVSRWAYKFTNITYSNLKGCAADYVTGSAYVFLGCTSVVMDGCGAEEIHGSFFECNQSRMVINGFRGVNITDNGFIACIFTQCGVTLTSCFFPEFSNSYTSKYWQVNDTTLNINNTVAPAPSRVQWASSVSWLNYTSFNGNYTIWGTSAWTVTGYLVNGIAHVYGDNPPDSSVTQFGNGARWELLTPVAGQPYKWVHVGSGVWKVAGNVSS
ncbi:hypothetical protein ACH6KY_06865 [Escherichia coli]|uniref:hypothetical protein n=1 Tax=Escherichia coli TaxID=562 RepID=UPI003AF00905